MKNEIKAVIYDLDDTLYDFDTPHREIVPKLGDYIQERYGVSAEVFNKAFVAAYTDLAVDMSEYVENKEFQGASHSRSLRLQYTLEKLGLPILPAALDIYDMYWGHILKDIAREDHVIEAMQGLKERGIRIGIGTNMTARIQFKKLHLLGLDPYIDFIVTSEESVFDKPDPAFFQLVIKKAGCAPENCLFVGDNVKFDFDGSKKMGMNALWYLPNKKADLREKKDPLGLAKDEDILKDHLDILQMI